MLSNRHTDPTTVTLAHARRGLIIKPGIGQCVHMHEKKEVQTKKEVQIVLYLAILHSQFSGKDTCSY